jgi:hypothetical protein
MTALDLSEARLTIQGLQYYYTPKEHTGSHEALSLKFERARAHRFLGNFSGKTGTRVADFCLSL